MGGGTHKGPNLAVLEDCAEGTPPLMTGCCTGIAATGTATTAVGCSITVASTIKFFSVLESATVEGSIMVNAFVK